MADVSVVINHKVNKACISFLHWMGYKTDNIANKRVFNHGVLLLFALTTLILSVLSLFSEVGLMLVAFHLVSLLLKLVILVFQMRAYKHKKNKGRNKALSRISSPYGKQFFTFVLLFVFLTLVLILVGFRLVEHKAFYNIAVFLSIAITFVKDLYDGIVALYSPSTD